MVDLSLFILLFLCLSLTHSLSPTHTLTHPHSLSVSLHLSLSHPPNLFFIHVFPLCSYYFSYSNFFSVVDTAQIGKENQQISALLKISTHPLCVLIFHYLYNMKKKIKVAVAVLIKLLLLLVEENHRQQDLEVEGNIIAVYLIFLLFIFFI